MQPILNIPIISDANLLLGLTFDIDTSLYNTYTNIYNETVRSSQIFLGNRKTDLNDILNSRNLVGTYKDKNNFIHGSLGYNLAGTSIGESDPNFEKKLNYSKAVLIKELDIASSIFAKVIVHPGYRIDKHKGLLTVAETLNYTLSNVGSIGRMFNSEGENAREIILENCAGEKNHLGCDFQELKFIIDSASETVRDQIGICIDTCHTYGAGLYDFGNTKHVQQFFQDFINIFGQNKLKVFHLNDSKEIWNSKKDRHANICEGYMFKKDGGESGLRQLISICTDMKIPLVLETPDGPSDYSKLIQSI